MRILLAQPSLEPPGGGNGVAAWMIEALKDEHELTVLTWDRVRDQVTNEYFGTHLQRGQFRRERVPRRMRGLLRVWPTTGGHLQRCLMLRHARSLAPDFDVVVTAHNEADFGRPSVQYVHFPWGCFPRPPSERRWYHLDPLVSGYYRACQAVSGFSVSGMRDNLTLVNSSWTGRLFSERFDMPHTVLYPPALRGEPRLPWPRRQEAFLCVGRITPSKEIERVIEVLSLVRRSRPGVRLRLIGAPDDRAYARHIRGLVAGLPWVDLEEGLSRSELQQRLGSHRYGIHGMRDEHFGIAVAELMLAGCIVFAPASGGPVEALGDQRLLYSDAQDAARKIIAVMENDGLQAELRAGLSRRAEGFSVESFIASFRQLIEDHARAHGRRA